MHLVCICSLMDILLWFTSRYHERVLANLLAVKADMCGRPFVVKINDVVFVGFPMLLHPVSPSQQPPPKRDTMLSIHIAFALPVSLLYVITHFDKARSHSTDYLSP